MEMETVNSEITTISNFEIKSVAAVKSLDAKIPFSCKTIYRSVEQY